MDPSSSSGTGGGGGVWEELIPDALALIFRKLSLQEILTVIPRVCKSWGRAVSGPYCWQEIDIDEWCQHKPEHIDRMLHMLIARSGGSLRKLCVSGIPNDLTFSYIADHAGSLRSLELPRSEISDSIVEQLAPRFRNVTFLDLSYCRKLGARALQAFGEHCKSLVGLRRVMHPLEVADKDSQDDEARAIARTMPRLQHLEMAYLLITTGAVLDILSGCSHLEHLDVRGCWDVKLDDRVLRDRYPRVRVLGPLVDERNYWDDDCSDTTTSSYLTWEELLDEDIVDDYDPMSDDDGVLEVRFYGAGFGDAIAGFHWPPSP